MPQLDLVTFIDQTIYVYIFFIFQYFTISIFVLPGIYQALLLKRLFYETILIDIQTVLRVFINSFCLLELAESHFESNLKEL